MVEKEHKNLLADIRGYVTILENSGERNFAPSDFFIESTYVSEQNKTLPCYLGTLLLMTRKKAKLLSMYFQLILCQKETFMVIIEVDLKRQKPSKVVAEYPDSKDLQNPILDFAKFIAPGVMELVRQRQEAAAATEQRY